MELHLGTTSTRAYIVYVFSLISSFMVYWTFGLMSTVAAGFTWVPLVSFIASILHFGLSSWLFLVLSKVGRVLAVLTGIFMAIWPLFSILSMSFNDNSVLEILLYLIPLLLNLFVIYNHFASFNASSRVNNFVKVWMGILPSSLFIWYVIYIIGLIRKGVIVIG